MVRLETFFVSLALVAVSNAAMAAPTKTPKATAKTKATAVALPAPETAQVTHFRLSQKKAAELVLRQGSKTQELNLLYEENRLPAATVLSNYDWKFDIESGYEYDKTQSFSPSTIADSKYIRYRTTATVQKSLLTGTVLGFEYGRLTQNANVVYPSGTVTIPPDNQVQDSLGVTLEQYLWGDSFGRADRAVVRASENTFPGCGNFAS